MTYAFVTVTRITNLMELIDGSKLGGVQILYRKKDTVKTKTIYRCLCLVCNEEFDKRMDVIKVKGENLVGCSRCANSLRRQVKKFSRLSAD